MRFVVFLWFMIFFIFGTACTPNQTINQNSIYGEDSSSLVSFRARGSYTTQSFIVSFFRSDLFDNLLTEKERLFLSVSSLVFAGNIEDRLKESLNLKYDQVRSYRVTYQVPNPYQNSQKLEVSGLLLVPNSSKPLPLLMHFHPTLLHKNMAPSRIPLSAFSMDPIQDYRLMMIFMALQGYIVLAPDYVGYGDSSEQIHPYLYKKAVAQSGAGLLSSAEEALYQLRQNFKKELFIMGYSQGGHGALAFAESLQNRREKSRQNSQQNRWQNTSPRGLELKAVSAGGGPYDLLYTIQEQLKQKSLWKSLTALLLQSYSFIYRWDSENRGNPENTRNSRNLSDAETWDSNFIWDLENIVKKADYAEIISSLHEEEDLSVAVRDLPDKTRSFFRSDFLREIQREPEDNLYAPFLDQNQVYDWRPESPIMLFHFKKDSIVPYGNLEIAYRSFRSWRSAPIERKNCNFKKIENLLEQVEEWSSNSNFEIEPNHITCDLIFFLETSEYFQKYFP